VRVLEGSGLPQADQVVVCVPGGADVEFTLNRNTCKKIKYASYEINCNVHKVFFMRSEVEDETRVLNTLSFFLEV
jgi:hypothetical protein